MVTLRSGQSAGPDVGSGNAAGQLFGARLSADGLRRAAIAATVPMVAVSVWLALTSAHVERPLATALYWSYLTVASVVIGVRWWTQRPGSKFGPLLVTFGLIAWVVSWGSADWPLVFDIGVLAQTPGYLLTFYLFLAFPMGRLEPPTARWLMAVLGLAALLFYVPSALLSQSIGGAGALTHCAPSCPENLLQLGSAPDVARVSRHLGTYCELAGIVGIFVVYVRRIRRASRPQRRALTPVAATALLFLPARFAFSATHFILHVDQQALDTTEWCLIVARVLMPLGFLIALLQAQRFAERTSQGLIVSLAAEPTPEQWSATVAAALDDPQLRLGYYDADTRRYLEPSGAQLTRPPTGSARSWVPVARDGQPVAAMVVDQTLAENPELVQAAASATLVAVERGHLEDELRASRARILEAGDAERRRIEQDLHDGAQQRLFALRTHLALASEDLVGSQEGATLERLGAQVDEAIEELRTLSHGIYPHLLADGVGVALAAVASRSTMPVGLSDDWHDRQSEAVETAVYFCCLECLQNAAKHAGAGASATIRLTEGDNQVGFDVADDGAGFDPALTPPGRGLANVADRVAAVGGTLSIDANPGEGTRVIGTIPV